MPSSNVASQCTTYTVKRLKVNVTKVMCHRTVTTILYIQCTTVANTQRHDINSCSNHQLWQSTAKRPWQISARYSRISCRSLERYINIITLDVLITETLHGHLPKLDSQEVRQRQVTGQRSVGQRADLLCLPEGDWRVNWCLLAGH